MSTEEDPTLKMDGFEDCVIGVMRRFGQDPPLVAYDYEKVIKRNMSDGMTEEEAVEHFYFNQIGAWMGEGTPCFVWVGEAPESCELRRTLLKVDDIAE